MSNYNENKQNWRDRKFTEKKHLFYSILLSETAVRKTSTLILRKYVPEGNFTAPTIIIPDTAGDNFREIASAITVRGGTKRSNR
jgi:hypothetical protein